MSLITTRGSVDLGEGPRWTTEKESPTEDVKKDGSCRGVFGPSRSGTKDSGKM